MSNNNNSQINNINNVDTIFKDSDQDDIISIETSNPEVQFILEYSGVSFLLYMSYKNQINSSVQKLDNEIFQFNEKRTKIVTKFIEHVSKGEISSKEARKLANEFLGKLGDEKFNNILKVLTKEKSEKKYIIDINQYCNENNFDKVMFEYAVDLAKDGNTKNYILNILKQKFNISNVKEIAKSAIEYVCMEMNAVNPEDFFYDGSPLNIPFLAQHIMKYHYFLTVGKLGTKDIYVYRDGIYVNDGLIVIRKSVNDLLSILVKESYRIEVIKYIQDEMQIERNQLNKDKYFINLNNGIYEVKTGKFTDHTPKVWSTVRIPVTYNPDVQCPKINQFLNDVVSPEDAQTLIEFVGYCLIPDTRMQKALMIYGSGKNGKSVFLELVNYLIGGNNISGVTLHKISSDKFASARLYGKLLNISPDISAKKLPDNSMFKMLVGGDKIPGEEKYKESFEFENTARLMFSANGLPEPAGDSDDNYAYYRRWLLIPFTNNFTGKEDKKIIQKLTTEEEKSGFLNLILEGLQTILKNGKFTHEKTTEEIEAIYQANLDSINMFFEKCVYHGGSGEIEKHQMHDAYVEWCKENSVIPMSYIGFCRKLKDEKGLKDYRAGKQNISYWDHVAFVDPLNPNQYLRPPLNLTLSK